MQTNVSVLEKKAIKFALHEDWESAIQVNLELLDQDPVNVKAKIRLGRAYLQTKQFDKAAKLFKEVLDLDPINLIARKNYELAKSKKVHSNGNGTNSNGKSLIKEPGTTTETKATITANRVTADTFSYGSEFKVQPLKTKANLIYEGNNIGEITDLPIIRKLHQAQKLDAKLKALFLKGSGKDIHILLRSTEPVFKGDKQDVKPYLKKGSIEEPELEIESFDDEE